MKAISFNLLAWIMLPIMDGFAKFLSTDEKIKANADRHPLKKIGTPLDIANTASFLLSEEASWITGQVLTVDGGISSLKV